VAFTTPVECGRAVKAPEAHGYVRLANDEGQDRPLEIGGIPHLIPDD